jgi:hypothetical protein
MYKNGCNDVSGLAETFFRPLLTSGRKMEREQKQEENGTLKASETHSEDSKCKRETNKKELEKELRSWTKRYRIGRR